METLRPNGQRAKIAIAVIWIIFGSQIVAIIFQCGRYNSWRETAYNHYIPEEGSLYSVFAGNAFVLIYFAASFLAIITFIQWFRRAYFNLHQLTTDLSWSEGWAAGGWFVPILNLFCPYGIMDDLYTKTSSLLAEKGLITAKISGRLLPVWWTLWILNMVLMYVSRRMHGNSHTAFQMIDITVAAIITHFIYLLLCLAAIKVIKDYSQVEPLLHRLNADYGEKVTFDSLYTQGDV